MAFDGFGKGPDGKDIDVFKAITTFIDMCANRGIRLRNGYQRQALCRELYLSLFELHDPTKKLNNALDLVLMTNKEGHWRQGPLARRMEDYRLCKIWDRYHYNFDDWIEQPRYRVEYQIDICLRENERDAITSGQQLDQVQALMQKFNLPVDKVGEVTAIVKGSNK